MSIAAQPEFCCYLRNFLLVVICGVLKRCHYQVRLPATRFSSFLTVSCRRWISLRGSGGSRGSDWGDRPPKTYESNFFHHDFVQFGEQHSRYKAILTSIVLPQSVVKYTWYLLNSSELVMRLDCQILLISSPPKLTGWICPCSEA